MKELGLVSYQQLTDRYRLGGHEHVSIPNHLEQQFAVTELNQVWFGDVVLTGQKTHHESAGNGMGNAQQASRSNIPQHSGKSC